MCVKYYIATYNINFILRDSIRDTDSFGWHKNATPDIFCMLYKFFYTFFLLLFVGATPFFG